MMTPNTGSILATLTQLSLNRTNNLTHRVKDLSVPEFICLLDFITAEFQQFLRAIDMINNEALESMLEQVMDAFTLKIGQILEADRTTIFLLDSEKNQLWAKIPQGDMGRPLEIRIPLNIGIAGHVAVTGECLNIAQPYDHQLFNREVDERPGYQTKNLLCMPIFSSSNQVVAVVQLLNKVGEGNFNETDEEHFRDFAASIGIILETCQSFYMAARNQRGAAALLRATASLGQSLDLEATLHLVMDQARNLMQADRSTLFMLSKERGELWTKVAKADGKTMMEIRIPSNRGIAGCVASTGQPLNIPDAYKDPRFDPTTDRRTGYKTRNILCMPVFNSAGDLIAVTQLINKQQGSFTASDEEFMRAFNIQAGIALENAKLFENLLLEKQYQKDILESLSDAVVSTDLEGRIVTINDAALSLLGCPIEHLHSKHSGQIWQYKLTGRYVWEVIPVDHLQLRLQDSLKSGARHYVPEQTLTSGIALESNKLDSYKLEANQGALPVSLKKNPSSNSDKTYILAFPDEQDPEKYIPWNEKEWDSSVHYLAKADVKIIDRSINLTVNPLTNPQGMVRGGLVVLEDISQEKRMKSMMYRYMTPGVAERVMALGEDSLKVGERREVSILFSDIRGYTTMTENMGANQVLSLLNEYFETMVEAVFDHEGTLDKFIGDALMAVFGAPLPLSENHAWKAVQSALDMRHRLKEFNQRQIFAHQPKIRFGIGISSGDVVSGNVGSQKRMDYTVIGDPVNVSARLETSTKEYLCDIIISEPTYRLCHDRIIVRELDLLRVKGKQEPLKVYELIGQSKDSMEPQAEQFLHLYQLGRDAYMHRKFQKAIAYFQDAQTLKPEDHPVKLHLQRAMDCVENPPGDDWDGVHNATF